MKFIRVAACAALLGLVLSATSVAADADNAELISQMNTAKANAFSYEESGRIFMAYAEASEYADLASVLADSGDVPEYEAHIAAGWRDSLAFEPELYLGSAGDGVFFGGDGVYVPGASAVKFSVPYGDVFVEDFYHLIPKTVGEVSVLADLSPKSEKTMRDIARGKDDEYLTENLRQLSRIEGRVYLNFCPSVNTMRLTRTLPNSYIQAFIHISDLADIYAPNVSLVYSLGDVREPGTDDVASFYPGDDYVDVFGVELCQTYSSSAVPSPEAAFDIRGEYHDPVLSVRSMYSEFCLVSGNENVPLIVTGASFPWTGRAAREDWLYQMERFYRLLPGACPDLTAVFYSNVSSALGVCNLRQNPEALALYKKCLDMPWYIKNTDRGTAALPVSEVQSVNVGAPVATALYCGGKYIGEDSCRIFLDGREVSPDGVTFTPGGHTLEVYLTSSLYPAKMAYAVTVGEGSAFSAQPIPAEADFNGNGIIDFGDKELLSARIAKWEVDLGGVDPDLNGDGKVNLSDMSVLIAEMSPGK